MRREGRPHGMVRTCPAVFDHPRPMSRILNQLTGPTTAGHFTKVPSRPTNHSKSSGKCGRLFCSNCHSERPCKSRSKSKWTHKTRLNPVDYSDDHGDYEDEYFDAADELGDGKFSGSPETFHINE